MRVLIYSPAFLPGVGGLETIVALLAEELARLGDEVVVVTSTPGDLADGDYRVVRRPSPRELLRWTRWCEVYHQANVSLKGLWPLLLVRRPWVVSHHSWYCRPDGRRIWKDDLKRSLLRFAARSIAVSRSMARDLGGDVEVVENGYRAELFRLLPGEERARELLFVGRLVSDKGTDLLVNALALLRERGLRPRLSIVGTGPEEISLRDQVDRLELGAQVEFLGLLRDEELVRAMNRHRVLAVPSRYQEPFGIVALEGIACGCLVVGSAGGGLGDAIGPCGLTFPNGDVGALADALARALSDERVGRACREAAPAHLARRSPASRAAEYHRIMAAAMARESPAKRRGTV